MRHFVVVESGPLPDVLRARCTDASAGAPPRSADRVPTPGPVPSGFGEFPSFIDEHLVVDVDACRDGSLLDCADVLQGSRTRSVLDALCRLAELTSAHPACGIAALPLADARSGVGGASGWAVAGGSDRSVVLVRCGPCPPYRASLEQSLLPSCLHAWLVAGHSLREWPHAYEAPSR
ncbi:hypothetical protein ACFVQ0_15050 [Streptomyces sp. NPDC057900]|uniref:hypothetical protein n=1 Tax=Streptomyces sp. NPDC057900 TaxID=3346274 RepID=UPI0036E5DB68